MKLVMYVSQEDIKTILMNSDYQLDADGLVWDADTIVGYASPGTFA